MFIRKLHPHTALYAAHVSHTPHEEPMLGCYRILDLTDERAFIAGRALSDFGAEVIKIEKPGGDPSRFRGPFYKGDPDPEKNLWWFSLNSNKKGITLDIESEKGREVFKKLVRTADAVLESFPRGYLDGLGLIPPVVTWVPSNGLRTGRFRLVFLQSAHVPLQERDVLCQVAHPVGLG